MAVTSGFFNSNNHDRTYSAEQFSSIFDGLIADGIYQAYEDALAVSVTGNDMNAHVGVGRAWFDHVWIYNDQSITIDLDPSDISYDRWDAIIIRIDKGNRVGSIIKKTGNPTASPAKPTMTKTDNVKEYPLAYIKVGKGANKVTNTSSTFQDKRGSDDCKWVRTIAVSAQSLEQYVAMYRTEVNARLDAWMDEIQQICEDEEVSVDAAVAAIVEMHSTRLELLETMLNGGGSGSTSGISDRVDANTASINNLALFPHGTIFNPNNATHNPSGTKINVDRPPHCLILAGANVDGTKPTKIGGNSFVVLTMNLDYKNAYNAQLAFGFGATPKIAMRVKNNAAKKKGGYDDETQWGPWYGSAAFTKL